MPFYGNMIFNGGNLLGDIAKSQNREMKYKMIESFQNWRVPAAVLSRCQSNSLAIKTFNTNLARSDEKTLDWIFKRTLMVAWPSHLHKLNLCTVTTVSLFNNGALGDMIFFITAKWSQITCIISTWYRCIYITVWLISINTRVQWLLYRLHTWYEYDIVLFKVLMNHWKQVLIRKNLNCY